VSGVPKHVSDEETLHRLLPPSASNMVVNGRVHPLMFYSSTEPYRVSVDRAAYRTADESLHGKPRHGIAALLTSAVRLLDVSPYQRLGVESLPELGNDAHAEIQADPTMSKNHMKTKISKKLSEIADVLRSPST